MTLQELKLKLTADTSGAQQGLNSVGEGVNKFGGIVKAVIGAAAVTAVVAFGKQCINAAGEAQQGEVMLRSSLGNIKGMTDKAKDAAVDWVNKMEASKSFDDADISAALQRMALKTGNLAEAQKLVSTAMEVARNKNVDLATATGLVDQAYNGSARALKQFGIEVGPDGKAQKGMTAIDALQQKVKGSGDAWSKTLEGQRETMKVTFGNLQEQIGGVLMPAANMILQTITPALHGAMQLISDNMPVIKEAVSRVLTVVKEVITWVIDTAKKVYEAMKPSIEAVVSILGPYVQKLFAWLQEHSPQIQAVLVGVAKAIGDAFKIVAEIIKGIIDSIVWVVNHVKSTVTGIKNFFTGGKSDETPTVGAHASGGWVGLHGPELSVVGEKGPEYIVPANQTGDMGKLADLLTQVRDEMHAMRVQMPGQIGGVVAGLGGKI